MEVREVGEMRGSGGSINSTFGLNIDKEEIKNFLSKAIKEEVALAMSSILETHFQRRKERTGMDYLEALLRGGRPPYNV